jgi:hypothetical protein
MILKQCKRCRVHVLKGQLDEHQICTTCRSREIKQEEPEPTPVEEPKKACDHCESMLPLSHYGPDKRTKDGLRKICRDCEAQQ